MKANCFRNIINNQKVLWCCLICIWDNKLLSSVIRQIEGTADLNNQLSPCTMILAKIEKDYIRAKGVT